MSNKISINDFLAPSSANALPVELSTEELALVFGSSGGNVWASSDAAFQAQQQAQQNFDQAVQNTLESVGNLEMGSATRHANEAYNAYHDLQQANANLEQAVDNDWADYQHEAAIDQQIANGTGYSPSDANMTLSSGLPGVGDGGGGNY